MVPGSLNSFTPIWSKGSFSFVRKNPNLLASRVVTPYIRMDTKIETVIACRCFDDCINDFTSKALSTKEETCVSRCVDKFIKTSDRLGQRFAEQNQAMVQGGGTGGAGAGFGGR